MCTHLLSLNILYFVILKTQLLISRVKCHWIQSLCCQESPKCWESSIGVQNIYILSSSFFLSFFSLNSVWMPWSPDAVWTTSRRWWWLRPSLSRSRRMSSTCYGRVEMQQICNKNVFTFWNRRRENNNPIKFTSWPGRPQRPWFLLS